MSTNAARAAGRNGYGDISRADLFKMTPYQFVYLLKRADITYVLDTDRFHVPEQHDLDKEGIAAVARERPDRDALLDAMRDVEANPSPALEWPAPVDLAPTAQKLIEIQTAGQFGVRPRGDGPDTAALRPLTDLGNAERFVLRYLGRVHYAVGRGWLFWDGRRWAFDDTGIVELMMKETIRAIWSEIHAANDTRDNEAIAKHAVRSENTARIQAALREARTEPGIPVRMSELDGDPWLLNVLNGTIDLRTGELRPHNRDDLITKVAPVAYDEHASLALWDQVLHQVTGGDDDFAAFLQRAAGTTIVGENLDEVVFLPHGPGATGKSTLLEAIKATLGDYAKTADFETFLKKRGDAGIRNDIARLAGARFVVSIEVDDGKQLAMALLKTLTGGEDVSARFLYAEAFEYRPAFTLWLAANHAPTVRADDDAAWRRILRLPFTNVIPKEQRDPTVKTRLRDPAYAGAAILAWAVRGCLAWQRDGLGVPPAVERATDSYRREMNPILGWVDECCDLSPQAWTATSQLWQQYQEWENDQRDGEQVSKQQFTQELESLGCTPKSRRLAGKIARGWLGIALKDDGTPRGDALAVDVKDDQA